MRISCKCTTGYVCRCLTYVCRIHTYAFTYTHVAGFCCNPEVILFPGKVLRVYAISYNIHFINIILSMYSTYDVILLFAVEVHNAIIRKVSIVIQDIIRICICVIQYLCVK